MPFKFIMSYRFPPLEEENEFTGVYFVQCNMTYGADKRVGRPCFIEAFSLCFNSCPSSCIFIEILQG